MFADFFSCLNLRSRHELAQCSSLPQTKQPLSLLFFFFLKVVVCFGFELFSCLFFFFLLRDALLFFLYTILAAEDSSRFPCVSFALTLSLTSRDPISSATLNSCLLCFREIAKSFQEGGRLAIIPSATNLSGNTKENCSSFLASACIS